MIDTIKDQLKIARSHLLKMAKNSNLGEETAIKRYLKHIPNKNRICVDIAASDGTTQSNTLFLYRQGWGGLAVEYNASRFAILAHHYKEFPEVNLSRVKVMPHNVCALLEANLIPYDFDFLNLDIDSYDYFVLDQLLAKFRPRLICAEVNEKIPPPIEFSVKYSPEHFWPGDHFYGQSLSQLNKLCIKYNYKIVELFYNNAFIMPNEIKGPKSLTPEQAYKAGYGDKSDRLRKMPYNKDMEVLQSLPKKKAIEFIRMKFAKYIGSYILR